MTAKPVSFHVDLAAGRTVMSPRHPQPVLRETGMDGWILNCTVEGRGRINNGANRFVAHPGDMLLFPPQVLHDYGYDPQARLWVHLWVYFFPRPAWIEWLNWPRAPAGVLRLRVTETDAKQRIAERFTELIDVARSPVRQRFDLAMNALEEILLRCSQVNPNAAKPHLDPRVQLALEYLCSRYTERISVARLAGVCGLSASRLSHLFRAQTGTAPMRYVEQYRIQRARELLLMTGKSVSEIAYEVGFRNPFYFSRVFRRHTRLSPREFRNAPASPRQQRNVRS
ncbi:MAG: arabinose operon transcriptional regulator AraC [Kiritimatiellae bacterium]|nr:arabinose operon transcriptional regulator AraC [Kiritimatiellia bacterium]